MPLSLTSFSFWALVAALTVLRRIPRLPPWAFQGALLLSTCVVLTAQSKLPGFLVVFAAASFCGVRLIDRFPRRSTLYAVAGLLTAAYALLYFLDGLDAVKENLVLIGVPYVYLRALSLCFDVQDGRYKAPGWLEGLAYLLPVHMLLAGPIQRFTTFRKELEAPPARLDADRIVLAADQVTTGLVKKLVFCEILREVFHFHFDGSRVNLALEIYAYAIHVYLDFSGYMNIAIGIGLLIGWAAPENFRSPYFSRNIVEFWTRWHITLGEFIRDYVFSPTNLALQRGALLGRPLAAGIACYIVSMAFCGFWHHPGLQFTLWGLFHAGGIIIFKLFEAGMQRALGRKMKAYRAIRPIAWASTLVTFTFVSVSFLFVVMPVRDVVHTLARLW